MSTIELIMNIIGWVLASASTLIAILIKVKALKTDKELNTANRVKTELENLQAITTKVQEYAKIAEANGGTGEEKKAFVLKSIEAFCNQYNIPYNELLVEGILEKLIEVTKQINSKE